MGAACAEPGSAQATSDPSVVQKTIVVSGRGEAAATPDMALLSMGVETTAKTAAAAMTENSARINAVLTALKNAGVEPRDLETKALRLSTQYDYRTSGRSTPIVTGYTARNDLSMRLRDIDRAGSVIDAAIKAGANQLTNFSLTVAEPTPLLDAARRDAIADARRKAALYAESAGVSVGPAIHISDAAGSGVRVPQAFVRAADMAESAAVPIEAGETRMVATVTVVFELR